MKRLTGIAITLVAIASSEACDPFKCFDQATPPLNIGVYEPLMLWVGDAFVYQASTGVDCETILTNAAKPGSFTWESSNPAVATVNEYGEVTALAPEKLPSRLPHWVRPAPLWCG